MFVQEKEFENHFFKITVILSRHQSAMAVFGFTHSYTNYGLFNAVTRPAHVRIYFLPGHQQTCLVWNVLDSLECEKKNQRGSQRINNGLKRGALFANMDLYFP